MSYLEFSLQRIAWSESGYNEYWFQEDDDEQALCYSLRASVLRSLGHHMEARNLLNTTILYVEENKHKSKNKGDWIFSAAQYEMAVNL